MELHALTLATRSYALLLAHKRSKARQGELERVTWRCFYSLCSELHTCTCMCTYTHTVAFVHVVSTVTSLLNINVYDL